MVTTQKETPAGSGQTRKKPRVYDRQEHGCGEGVGVYVVGVCVVCIRYRGT